MDSPQLNLFGDGAGSHGQTQQSGTTPANMGNDSDVFSEADIKLFQEDSNVDLNEYLRSYELTVANLFPRQRSPPWQEFEFPNGRVPDSLGGQLRSVDDYPMQPSNQPGSSTSGIQLDPSWADFLGHEALHSSAHRLTSDHPTSDLAMDTGPVSDYLNEAGRNMYHDDNIDFRPDAQSNAFPNEIPGLQFDWLREFESPYDQIPNVPANVLRGSELRPLNDHGPDLLGEQQFNLLQEANSLFSSNLRSSPQSPTHYIASLPFPPHELPPDVLPSSSVGAVDDLARPGKRLLEPGPICDYDGLDDILRYIEMDMLDSNAVRGSPVRAEQDSPRQAKRLKTPEYGSTPKSPAHSNASDKEFEEKITGALDDISSMPASPKSPGQPSTSMDVDLECSEIMDALDDLSSPPRPNHPATPNVVADSSSSPAHVEASSSRPASRETSPPKSVRPKARGMKPKAFRPLLPLPAPLEPHSPTYGDVNPGRPPQTPVSITREFLRNIQRRIQSGRPLEQEELEPGVVAQCMATFPVPFLEFAWISMNPSRTTRYKAGPGPMVRVWTPTMFENIESRTYTRYFPAIIGRWSRIVVVLKNFTWEELCTTTDWSSAWWRMPRVINVPRIMLGSVLAASAGLLLFEGGKIPIASKGLQVNGNMYTEFEIPNRSYWSQPGYESAKGQPLLFVCNPLTAAHRFLPPIPGKVLKELAACFSFDDATRTAYRLIVVGEVALPFTPESVAAHEALNFKYKQRHAYEVAVAIYSSAVGEWVHFDSIYNGRAPTEYHGGRTSCAVINQNVYFGGLRVSPTPERKTDPLSPAIFFFNCSAPRIQEIVINFNIYDIFIEKFVEAPKMVRAGQSRLYAVSRTLPHKSRSADQIYIMEVLLNEDGSPTGTFKRVKSPIMPPSIFDAMFTKTYGRKTRDRNQRYNVAGGDRMVAFKSDSTDHTYVAFYDLKTGQWCLGKFPTTDDDTKDASKSTSCLIPGTYEPVWTATP